MADIIIKASTPIEDLRKAGVMPNWMTEDCEEHSIYDAENILCGWDLEDGWELGDCYDAQSARNPRPRP